MTSISALSSHHHYASPLKRLQDEQQAEVGSGAVNASHQSALSSALTEIDSVLQSSSVSDQSADGGSSADTLKSRIDGLIQQEVSAGKLTDEQATELQGILKAALSQGPAGAGGPPPGPPPGDGPPPANVTDGSSSGSSVVDLLQQSLDSLKALLTDSTSSGTTGSSGTRQEAGGSSSATDGSASGNAAADVLEQFLQLLKTSLADSTYSTTRSDDQTKANDPSMSGVLIDDRI